MTNRLRWLWTLGGPHMLAPVEHLGAWRGGEDFDGLSPTNPSDYARACRIKAMAGSIPCGGGSAVVFGGWFGSAAWVSRGPEENLFLQCISVDDDELADALAFEVGALENRVLPDWEENVFETGRSGRMVVFDAVELGAGEIAGLERHEVGLRPGVHRVRSGAVAGPGFEFVVSHMTWIADRRVRLVASAH